MATKPITLVKVWGMRLGAFAVPVLAGILLMGSLQSSRGAPERLPASETILPVRVIPAEPVVAIPRTLGYGTVQPGNTWRAVARVGGEVISRLDGLGLGSFVDQGVTLFQVDPLDYQLAVTRNEAAVASAAADLTELDQTEKNTRSLLAIEQRTLNLAREEFERQKSLADRGTVSRATADSAERELNLREGAYRELSNALALLPAQRALLEAKLAQAEADLHLSQLDLERTEITAPFTGRVAEESLTVGQVVNAGDSLVTLDDVSQAEVEAEIPISRIMPLFRPGGGDALPAMSAEAIAAFLENAGFKAKLRLLGGASPIEWDGEVVRIRGSLDPVARTVGIVVAVANPYSLARPGERPPLVPGMYVEVELSGAPRDGLVVIPRSALKDGSILVADEEDRLRYQSVEVAYHQGDLVLLEGALPEDLRVVVSDVAPAIDGMKLVPTRDLDLLETLRSRAAGTGPVR